MFLRAFPTSSFVLSSLFFSSSSPTSTLLSPFPLFRLFSTMSTDTISSIPSSSTSTASTTSPAIFHLLTMGCTPSIVHSIRDSLNSQYGPSLFCYGLVVEDSNKSMKEVAKVCQTYPFDAIIIGYGVRSDVEWFAKVKKAVDENSKGRIITHKGPSSEAAADAVKKEFPEQWKLIVKNKNSNGKETSSSSLNVKQNE